MAEFNFDKLSPEEKEQLAREGFKSKEKEFAKRAKEEQEAHYKKLVDETIEKAVESVIYSALKNTENGLGKNLFATEDYPFDAGYIADKDRLEGTFVDETTTPNAFAKLTFFASL